MNSLLERQLREVLTPRRGPSTMGVALRAAAVALASGIITRTSVVGVLDDVKDSEALRAVVNTICDECGVDATIDITGERYRVRFQGRTG